jgi:hypothetical protein
MFNFRNIIPWPRATDYQKLSEELYEVGQHIKQEEIMANKLGEFSYSVGPSVSFADGASITFKQTGGLTTTVELGHKHVQSLIGLLETVLAHSGEPNE